MRHLRNIAMRDYQESVTSGQTNIYTHRQKTDKVIPMCRYALQATQKWVGVAYAVVFILGIFTLLVSVYLIGRKNQII